MLRHLLCLLVVASTVAAQGDREGQGLGREQMWPAPTARDWKKPCLITWQRTWEDAVAVSKETGKPILVCINMDGEIASEHYAGVRYRQPEVAKLYEKYVTVIASVYRHNPRDHDDQGRRIPCPRFGGVTCSEHIWIEPIIYEKFCDGQRVSPRHICVDHSGKEVYDVFYTNDTASVFDAVRDRRKEMPPGKTIVRGDRPVIERVASREVSDRNAVEAAYRKGDAAARKALLDAALKNSDAAQIDLLRLAIFGLDINLSKAARKALVGMKTADATQLVSDALQVPMDNKERDALIGTLKRLGTPRARWLAGVHQGLGGRSVTIKLDGWSKVRAGATYPAPFAGSGRTEYVEMKARAAAENPKDPKARVDLAEATLAMALKAKELYALNPRIGRLAARHLYKDALRLAIEAEALGAEPWRTNTVLALAAYYTGKTELAYKHAELAVKGLPPDDAGWNSMAVVTIFAESRWKAIKAAVRATKNWPPSWLTDLHSAYSLLLRHPLGTDAQVDWHYEFLDWLGIHRRAWRVLNDGLERFTESQKLHQRLRDRLLKYRGPKALEATYERMLKNHKEPARLEPFAGVASGVAADHLRKIRRNDLAMAAYERAIAHFERAIAAKQGNRTGAEHAIALARAARARIAYQLGDDDTALKEILASFTRRPASAGSRDGAGITPGETAQMLLARLKKDGKADQAKRLTDALRKIDAELLRPDRGLTGG